MMSGSMVAPALPSISNDLHMSPESAEISLSIFILAFAIGPLVLAPLTEVYGRRPVWLVSGIAYSIWNIVGGFSKNKGTLIASRLFSGLGGSVDFVVRTRLLFQKNSRFLTKFRLRIPSEVMYGLRMSKGKHSQYPPSSLCSVLPSVLCLAE